MRLVLDTDVVVAGMRSPSGGEAAVLLEAAANRVALLVSVPLAIEYEATCFLAEHRVAAGLSEKEVGIFLDAVLSLAEPVEGHFLWRPRLRDPADEMVLETAVNGRAQAIVTFNHRDYGRVPEEFGIALARPADVLARIRK